MRVTLYDILNIAPDASPEEIDSAYRRKALQTHPDRSGSETAFQAVQQAFDVLSDPQRRQRYDETGDFDDGIERDKVSGILAHHLGLVVQVVVNNGRDVAANDLVEGMVHSLRAAIKELEGEKKPYVDALVIWKKMAGRFRRKKKATNMLEIFVATSIRQHDEVIAQIDGKIADIKKAQDELSDYVYDFVKKQQEKAVSSPWSPSGKKFVRIDMGGT